MKPGARNEAKTNGLPRYFTGVPCSRGHVADRNTLSGGCVACAKENSAKAELTRAPRAACMRAYLADYGVKNAKKISERNREKYLADPAKFATRAAEWAKSNPGKRKAIIARYHATEHGKIASRVKEAKRRTRKTQAGGSHTAADVDALHIAQDGMCAAHCGSFLCDSFEVDHVVPVVDGGSSSVSNLQLLCVSCNRVKGRRSMAFLMNKLAGGSDKRLQ